MSLDFSKLRQCATCEEFVYDQTLCGHCALIKECDSLKAEINILDSRLEKEHVEAVGRAKAMMQFTELLQENSQLKSAIKAAGEALDALHSSAWQVFTRWVDQKSGTAIFMNSLKERCAEAEKALSQLKSIIENSGGGG